MKFKHLFAIYAVMWLCVIIASPNQTYANSPTVTVTKTAQTFRASVYLLSFSTNISLADTAFIYNENSNWFAIDGVGAHAADTTITLECFSSETTADSVHYSIIWQVSSAASPNITARGVSSDWVTAYVDSATFHSKVSGSNPTVARFPKLKYAGQATKMRILVAEMQTGAYTAKDANQTVTLRLLIPRR